jgi:WD40 repeat protein
MDLRLQVKVAIERAADDAAVDPPRLDPDKTLWEWFYRVDAAFWNERSRRVQPVLVFDQFEEAFTIGGSSEATSAQTGRFFDELVDLVRGSVPPSVATRLEAAPAEALGFTTGRDPCHILIALRKEFLADLLRLRNRLPMLLEHHLELSGMSPENAKRVITGPGGHLVEEGVAERIVTFVAAARRTAVDQPADAMVDPAILSIFCQQLNLKRKAARLPRITAELVAGTQDAIIADFYRGAVTDLGPDVQRFIEEDLLTESGYRNSVALDEALLAPGVTPAVIGTLIDRRLVRLEGSGPTGRLELTHDVLADPIVENRNGRRLQEQAQRARQAEEQARRAKEEAEDRERRARELEQARALVEKEHQNAELARQLADQRQLEQQATARLLEMKRNALRRQQHLGAGLALALFAAVMLAAYSLYARSGAERARRDAEWNLSMADLAQAVGLSAAGSDDRGLAYLARALRIDPDNAAARGRAFNALLHLTWPIPEADMKHDRPVLWAQFDASGKRIATVSDDHTARVWSADGTPIGGPLLHDGRVFLARFNRDGLLLTVAEDGFARLWDASSGTLLRKYEHPGTHVTWAAFDPAGDRIATGAADGTLRIWNGDASNTMAAHRGALTAAVFNRAGDELLTSSEDGTAALWNVRTGALVRRFSGHADWVVAAQFSPDERVVATASRDGTARLWDVQTGRELLPPLRHTAAVWSARFDPAGVRLVTASDDGTAVIWDTASGRRFGAPLVHGGPVVSAVFSPDGLRIITGSRDQTARLWDATTGTAVAEPLRHDAAVESALFSPDGQHAVTASDDGHARLWDIRLGAALPATLRLSGTPLSAQFTPDGSQVAVIATGADGGLLFWDGASFDPAPRAAERTDVVAVDFTPDGALMLTVEGTTARILRRATGQEVATLRHDAEISSARFSPDGRLIVTASVDGTARTWDAPTGKPIATVRHQDRIWSAAFSSDGMRIVTASSDRTARIWDARSGAPGPVLRHLGEVFTAQFNRAGTRVLTASADFTAKLWNPANGETVAVLPHEATVLGALFNPAGDLALTFSADRTARLWETDGGHAIATLAHDSPVDACDFSPDGQRVVTAAHDGTLRVWDAQPGQPRTVILHHDAAVYSVRFTPDGERVASASADGTVRLWSVPRGTRADGETLPSLLELVSGYRLNAEGVPVQVADRIGRIRQLRQQRSPAQGDALASRVAAWVFADRASRTISPFSSVSLDDYIRRQVASGLPDAVRETRQLFGWHALLSGAR